MGLCSSKSTLSYQSNPRLTSRPEQPGRNYTNKIGRIVEAMAALERQADKSPLEFYLIERCDEWFEDEVEEKEPKRPALPKIGIDFLERVRKPKPKPLEYSQLANAEDLLLLFKQFERDYHVTQRLANIVSDFEQMKDRTKFYIGNSLRRQQAPIVSELDSEKMALPFYQKLVLHIYQQLLKKELAGQNEDLNAFICQFHNTIGLRLFDFIRYRKVTHHQLLKLVYFLLQLSSSRKKAEQQAQLIRKNLQRVREMFQVMLIEEQYTYDLPIEQQQNIRYVSSSYVSDLFRRSLAEIDNPTIFEAEQPLKPLFIFPVQTVKTKNKRY